MPLQSQLAVVHQISGQKGAVVDMKVQEVNFLGNRNIQVGVAGDDLKKMHSIKSDAMAIERVVELQERSEEAARHQDSNVLQGT